MFHCKLISRPVARSAPSTASVPKKPKVANHGNKVGPPGTTNFDLRNHRKCGAEMFSGSGVMSSGLAMIGWLMMMFDIALASDGSDFSNPATLQQPWGNNGYLQISTNSNVCGIHSEPSYLKVSGSVQV